MVWKELPATTEEGRKILYVRQAGRKPAHGYDIVDPKTGGATGHLSRIDVSRREVHGQKQDVSWTFISARPEVEASILRSEEAKERAARGEKSPSETWESYIARMKAAGKEPQFPSIHVAKKYGYPVTPEIEVGEKKIPVLAEEWGRKKIEELESIEKAKAIEVAEKEAERQKTLGARIRKSLYERQVGLVLKERPEAKAVVTPTGWAVVPPTAKVYPKELPIIRERKRREELVEGALFQLEKKATPLFERPPYEKIFTPEAIKVGKEVKKATKEQIEKMRKLGKDISLGVLAPLKPAYEIYKPKVKQLKIDISRMRQEQLRKSKEYMDIAKVDILPPRVRRIYEAKIKPLVPKIKEEAKEKVKAIKEFKIKIPTKITRKGEIIERKELKEILPPFPKGIKPVTEKAVERITAGAYEIGITQLKPLAPVTEIYAPKIKEAMPTKKELSTFYGKTAGVGVDITTGVYEGIRQKPEKVLAAYGLGMAVSGVLDVGGSVLRATGATAKLAKKFAKLPKGLQKAAFYAPTLALGGAYVAGKGIQIGMMEKGRARAVGEAISTEYLPFVLGQRTFKYLSKRYLTTTDLVSETEMRQPIIRTARQTRPIGKITPVAEYTYEYGVRVPAKKGFKIEMKPEQYARYLEKIGKIELEYPKKIEIGKKVYTGLFQEPKKIEVALTAFGEFRTPFEKGITLKHELIHYKTPKPLFRIEETLKIPYKYKPSEILAYNLAPKIKSFTVKVGKQTYKDLLKPRTIRVISKELGTGKVVFKYPREKVGVYQWGKGERPLVSQTGVLRTQKTGLKPEYYGLTGVTSKGKAVGVLEGEGFYDIYFRQLGKGKFKVEYVAKGKDIRDIGRTVLKTATIKRKLVKPRDRLGIPNYEQEITVESRPFQKEYINVFKEGGSEFWNPRRIDVGELKNFYGAEIKYGARDITKIMGGGTSWRLTQKDFATGQIEKISKGYIQMVGGKKGYKPQLKYGLIQTERLPSTIEYVTYKPAYRPDVVTIEKYMGDVIRKSVKRPKLTTKRQQESIIKFLSAEYQSGVTPIKYLKKAATRMDKAGQLYISTQLKRQPTVAVQTQIPKIQKGELDLKQLKSPLSIGDVSLMLRQRPYQTLWGIPFPETEVSKSKIEQVKVTRPITRVKPIVKPVTEVRQFVRTKPIVMVKPIVRTRTITKPIVRVRPITEVFTKAFTEARTITETKAITETMVKVKVKAKTKVLAKALTITRVPTMALTRVPPPPPPPPPPIIPSLKFPEFKPKKRKKKRKELFPTYKPSLVGVWKYKKFGVTIQKAPPMVGLGERLLTEQMIKDVRKIGRGMV